METVMKAGSYRVGNARTLGSNEFEIRSMNNVFKSPMKNIPI